MRSAGTPRLMALLMYGAGLRVMECVRLRIKDLDFEAGTIRVRDGKGRKDRVTMLPVATTAHFARTWRGCAIVYEADRAGGRAGCLFAAGAGGKISARRNALGMAVAVSGGEFVGRPAQRSAAAASRFRKDDAKNHGAGRARNCGWASGSHRMCCGIRLRRICWSRARTSARCRICWVTRTWRRR